MLFDIPLHAINESVLQTILNTPEGRQIEYKRELPKAEGKDAYESIKEFLKDVSAMANTIGGDIVYGVKEGVNLNGDTVAESLEGLEGIDIDKVKQRLDNTIRTSIEPTLIAYDLHPVTLENGRKIIIIRVSRSWNAPHVVRYQKHWRFYYRSSVGSHPMDVTELRYAMASSESYRQRLEEFRLDRLAKIAANPALDNEGKIVIHFQPLDSVRADYQVDLRNASKESENLILLSWEGEEDVVSLTRRPNFDGLLIFLRDYLSLGYIQLFRNGAIEEVDVNLLSTRVGGGKYIRSVEFEARIISGVAKRLKLLRNRGVKAPIMLQVSLLGVRDYKMNVLYYDNPANALSAPAYNRRAEKSPIDHDDLILPGILIDDIPSGNDFFLFAAAKLRDTFDVIWNAAGLDRSLHYDSQGTWSPQIHT